MNLTDEEREKMRKSYGVAQVVDGPKEESTPNWERLLAVHKYMTKTVFVDPLYKDVRDTCKNQEERCTFWASIGECEKNPSYMITSCGPACFACDKMVFEVRCPIPPDLPDALEPGDLNKLFERLTTDPYYQQYEPQIMFDPGQTISSGRFEGKDAPWVITMDSFLSQEECDALIKLGAKQGYEQSEDVGERLPDGTYDGKKSDGRTSTNAWCLDNCYRHPVTQRVLDRIANLTDIPESNFEHLQLLRYEETQFYEVHHDYIEYQTDYACGVRVLTVFMYLNDVEAGGGTNFPDLNLTVQPKAGRVLIWPSVLDSDPHQKDGRTDHQALPVEKGIKFAANAWIHQHDFKTPFVKNCI